MMNEIIPGGRQRASSESDILDENIVQNAENHSLTLDHRHFSKSLGHHLSNQINSDEESINSEREYYTLQHKDKRRNKPLLKSVKKIVSRLRQKGHSHSSTDVNQDMNGGKGGYNPQTNNTSQADTNATSKRFSDSTSRPLITKPQTFTLPWKVCPGTVGIQNHGNTCFMNAVLQCLSNTDALTGYFVSKQHKQDLRAKGFSKKFSHKNDLTEQFAILLESLWSNNYSSDVSSSFRNTVGKYNSQYKGSSQHDAQEFLLWLLDSINEELVVTSKKKQKVVKGKDTSDDTLAEELLATSSGCLVYNLFQALYRSSLQCPNCNKQSNTFETYLCLSLPLPHKTKRPVFVTIVYLDGSPRQIKVGLEINIQDTIKELREILADNMKIPVSQLVLCQIHEDGFRCTFSDDQPISDISETEMIYALETLPLPALETRQESPYLQLIVLHTVKESAPVKYFRFSPPQVLKVARDVDYKMLQIDILKHMAKCIKEGLLSQKLGILFKLRVVDGSSGKGYLQHDVEMPLLTSLVERALSMCRDEYGPQHIKLVAEWEPSVQERVIVDENNKIDEHDSFRRQRNNSQQPFRVSLNDCLQLFTREETLSGDDAWNCPHCKKQQQAATKTIGLWSVPNVLVIHLKRFRQVGARRNKLNTLVEFPVKGMDMSRHILQRNSSDNDHDHQIYDLYGVCNHYGNMLGGHYTAFCKNPLDEKWYEFDDSKVKPISEAEVKTSSAYLLFYQKRGSNSHVFEALKNKSHWIFRICPSLLNVNPGDFKNVKEQSPKDENLLSVNETEEKEGIFSRQNSGRSDFSSKSEEKSHISNNLVDKPPTGATGHVSSKLVHNVSSQQVSPDVLHNALSQTSKSTVSSVSSSTKHNGDFKYDTTDNLYDVNLKVKLPPSSGTKQTNLKVDLSDRLPPNRSNLYDRQNASRAAKSEKVISSQPKNELPVKSYSENYSLTGTYNYNTVVKKQTDVYKQPVDTSQRTYTSQTISQQESDVQRNKLPYQNKPHHDEVESSVRIRNSSPQQPRRPVNSNWSTPQPPRKNISAQQSKSPFKRQNSIPSKRSSNVNYTRLPSSRSEEDLSMTRQKYYEEKGNPKELLNVVIPSNQGVHDIINKYNTMTKKMSSNTIQDKQPTDSVNRRNDQSQKSDGYRRSESYQNAKNNYMQNEQLDKISKSNDDKYEQKRRQQFNRTSYHENQPNYFTETPKSQELERDNRMPKSKTDDNLVYNNTPHINEIGSRKPVYEPSSSETSSITETRYKPHKHYSIKPREKMKSFKKEKMYSPCMKESSV